MSDTLQTILMSITGILILIIKPLRSSLSELLSLLLSLAAALIVRRSCRIAIDNLLDIFINPRFLVHSSSKTRDAIDLLVAKIADRNRIVSRFISYAELTLFLELFLYQFVVALFCYFTIINWDWRCSIRMLVRYSAKSNILLAALTFLNSIRKVFLSHFTDNENKLKQVYLYWCLIANIIVDIAILKSADISFKWYTIWYEILKLSVTYTVDSGRTVADAISSNIFWNSTSSVVKVLLIIFFLIICNKLYSVYCNSRKQESSDLSEIPSEPVKIEVSLPPTPIINVQKIVDDLVQASFNGNIEEVRRIIDNKVITDINSQHSDNDLNLHGESVLSIACKMQRGNIVSYLLSLPESMAIDVNIVNKTCEDGFTTPLINACRHENVIIVKSLLETKKVDCQLEDQFKKSALSWAKDLHSFNILKLLLLQVPNVSPAIHTMRQEGETLECSYCFGDEVAVVCGNQLHKHLFCKGCFSRLAKTQISDGTFFSNNRNFICPENRPPCKCIFNIHDVYHGLEDGDTWSSFLRANDDFVAQINRTKFKVKEDQLVRKNEDYELQLKIKSSKVREDTSIVLLHTRRIQDQVLTTRCPHCQHMFASWSDCFFVTCEQDLNNVKLGCKGTFCGWCLEKIKNHDHVKNCNLSLNKGNLFGSDNRGGENASFKLSLKARRYIREQAIADYLNKSDLNNRLCLCVLNQLEQENDMEYHYLSKNSIIKLLNSVE